MARMDLERRRIWAAAAVGALLLLAGIAGCGVKGPPVPPQRPPLPAVEALTGRLDGDTVTLNWRHNPDAKGVAGYVVLRAQSDPAQPPCPDCPVVYQRAGTINADKHSRQITFSEPVPAGFRYTYLVRALGAAGDQGPEKASVEIDRTER
ncbi:MAG: hypothetical protein KFF50_17610 [Desulfatitalea sp.]|nr:hypothetical protein [Desulfatitalea sp.]